MRFGTMNDDPHLRLGLMVLDGAAELLLHRECDARLRWAGTVPGTGANGRRAARERMDKDPTTADMESENSEALSSARTQGYRPDIRCQVQTTWLTSGD